MMEILVQGGAYSVKIIRSCIIVLLGVCLLGIASFTLRGQTGAGPASGQTQKALLLVRTDLDCQWQLDGQKKGFVHVDDRLRVEVGPGQHLVEAKATDGADVWERVVDVDQGRSVVVSIALGAERLEKLVWTDPDTRLHWTRRSSDSNVGWDEAKRYCSTLKLAGISGWRLPTDDELEAINPIIDRVNPSDEAGMPGPCDIGGGTKMKGTMELPSGAVWTDSKPVSDDDAFGYRFNACRAPYVGNFDNIKLKVLCVAGDAK
jgi:hypothetical protein